MMEAYPQTRAGGVTTQNDGDLLEIVVKIEDESPDEGPTMANDSADGSKSNTAAGQGEGRRGQGTTRNDKPPPVESYNLTEEQEEAIASWLESKKLLYDMKDRRYKNKALKRQLWEEKAAEYGVDYRSIQTWYLTQRTRFSKLRESQPKRASHKRSVDGLFSGDEEDPILTEEASENDSDRDRFIRRIFGFLKPHIKRRKKDAQASFKEDLASSQTSELPARDESTIASSPTDDSTAKTSGSKAAGESCRESHTMGMRGAGSSSDIQERLVKFITRDQQVNRAIPFCKYLEAELEHLHDACLDPAYEDITTVLNHYRKMSRRLRLREAAGDQVSLLEEVPSVFQSQQLQVHGSADVLQASSSATSTYPRVGQLQHQSVTTSDVNTTPTKLRQQSSSDLPASGRDIRPLHQSGDHRSVIT